MVPSFGSFQSKMTKRSLEKICTIKYGICFDLPSDHWLALLAYMMQVSVVDELGVPVKFIGVGETADDLQPFDPEAFVEALFPEAGDA